jgi:uncharacterized protein YbjT (DUF2867 family)
VLILLAIGLPTVGLISHELGERRSTYTRMVQSVSHSPLRDGRAAWSVRTDCGGAVDIDPSAAHQTVPQHDSKHTIEEHLRTSGLRVTMVRPTPFMEVRAPSLEHGEIVLRLPLPEDVALKMISIRDIGRVAAALLLDTAEAPGGAVELVGDELTGPQIAAAFGARAGLPARYEALPLSVLPSDLDRAMFRQFAKWAECPSDPAVVRAIEPATLDLAEWIRSTGWSAPTTVAGS